MKKDTITDRLIAICIVLLAIALMISLLWNCSITHIRVRGSDNTTISTEANRDSLSYDGVEWNWDLNKAKKDTIVKDTL